MRWRTAAVALVIVGAGSIVAGVAVGRPRVSFEGVWFTRASGTPAHSAVFQQTGTGLFSPQDGNLWIGAGLACFVAVLVIAWLSLRAERTADHD